MEDLTGKQLGPYEIVEKLGTGGMGSVYLGVHTRIGKKVALKILHSEHAEDPEVLERFLNEAQAVNEIGHQNIVDIADICEGGDGVPTYLVMELLAGEVLRQAMRSSGPFPPERATRIALQIASALEATHAVGIVHRDLKPDNVFLTTRAGQDDFVVLLDFGIAKLGDRASFKTKTGTMIGTPQYMSPEQTEGKGVGPRTDVYALGIMLYEMLSGKVPFDGGTIPAILKKIWMDEPTPLETLRPDLPRGLSTAIMRAFQREAAKRTRSMDELSSELVSIMPGIETLAMQLRNQTQRASPRSVTTAEANSTVNAVTGQDSIPLQQTAAAGSISSVAPPITASRISGEAAPVLAQPATTSGRWAAFIAAGIGIAALLSGAALFLAAQYRAGEETAPEAIPMQLAEDDEEVATDKRDEKTARPDTTEGDESAAAPPAASAPDGGRDEVASTPATSRPRDRSAGTRTAGSVAVVPLDAAVMKSKLLARHGKPIHKCFHEFEGMDYARVAFEVSPAGTIEHYEYERLLALDYAHRDVLVKCLDKAFKRASFPRTKEGGRFSILFEKGKLSSAPLHLKLDELHPLRMRDFVLKSSKARLTECFRKHPDVVRLTTWLRVDANGKVLATGKSYSHGFHTKEVMACVDAVYRSLSLPKSRAGGRFDVELVRDKLGVSAPKKTSAPAVRSVTIDTVRD